MTALVTLKDVTVVAGGRTLLENVTLEVARGEALLLRGPNGGGKTSLLRLLSGEVAPLRGERVYRLGGQEQRSAVRARRSLAVVGPDAEAFYLTRDWAVTVRDLLLGAARGERLNLWQATPTEERRVADVAALTGLGPLLGRDVRTLSHGQRRRAVLGAALMPAPELLLLDEFTDGLSGEARAELGAVIAAVHASGVAVVLASHRPEEAPELPWRTLSVQGGRVVSAAGQGAPTADWPAPWPALRVPPTDGLPRDLVTVRSAEVYRNGHRALGPLTWTWRAGQHWLVTGENGSGKSTLARLIAGELHAALGGQVTRPFLTRDLLSERRRGVGLVSAELGIRQRREWTGRDVIGSAWDGTEGFAHTLDAAQHAEVARLAAVLNAADLLDRPADTLSQGQLRRLLLARAAAHRPRLLLLDEGLDFLDAGSRAAFLGLLPGLVRGGTHLLIVAHRASDAPAGLTHHLHLSGGQAAYQGPRTPGAASDSAHLQALP
ncbi:ATP-binding cassette domain-containing protein [Deinococcus sp.]|uniref:ATP-binding cassette domain-containing protein n=1 Tax=Deinococcus sp. TaxID=47478 RepID=UPI0025B93E85|nr:ATP-binding cassette domain-containing protein [Deinococcus sp.]